MKSSNYVRLICGLGAFFYTTLLSAQWHGYGTQLSESSLQLRGLPSVPELHTDMPLDCLIGYVAMDSIARTIGVFEAARYPENAIIPQLRIVSRYIYGMADYDPILLYRHFLSTMDSNFPNEKYRSYPANSFFPIILEIYKRQNQFGAEYGMLIASSYVLHIRVLDVREGIDSTMFNGYYNNVNVACEVLETFKGQRLPENCYTPHNTKQDQTQPQPLGQSSCLIYSYTPKNGESTVKPGDEIVIFLNLAILRDNWFGLRPEGGFDKTVRGCFVIQNGHVHDPDNVWGQGTNPTLSDFRTALLQKISEIRSWK